MITLTGTYGTAYDPDPPDGYVLIQPMVTATRLMTIVTQAPVRADLTDGAFTVDIIASDDPGWSSGPIPYVFTERIAGQSAQWMAYVNGPGPVDMSELTPLVEAPPIPEGTDHGTLTGRGDNDHTQYPLRTEADQRYEFAGEAAAGDSAHVAAGDPHSQYLTVARADALYQRLDALESLAAKWGGGIS